MIDESNKSAKGPWGALDAVGVDDVLGGEDAADFSVGRMAPEKDGAALRRARRELGLLPEEPFPQIKVVASAVVPRGIVILVDPQTGARTFIKVGSS